MGSKPSFVDVWIEGHKGPDPENLEVLCDEQATEKLVSILNRLRTAYTLKESTVLKTLFCRRSIKRKYLNAMDWSSIGGRPHLTLKLYTTLEVGYAMAGM